LGDANRRLTISKCEEKIEGAWGTITTAGGSATTIGGGPILILTLTCASASPAPPAATSTKATIDNKNKWILEIFILHLRFVADA